MRALRDKTREAGRNLAKIRSGGHVEGVAALRERVTVLEAEVQECRQLNLRLAELTDVVQELLVPMAQRDEARLSSVLEKYAQGL